MVGDMCEGMLYVHSEHVGSLIRRMLRSYVATPLVYRAETHTRDR
jgi:hypothetical protein